MVCAINQSIEYDVYGPTLRLPVNGASCCIKHYSNWFLQCKAVCAINRSINYDVYGPTLRLSVNAASCCKKHSSNWFFAGATNSPSKVKQGQQNVPSISLFNMMSMVLL